MQNSALIFADGKLGVGLGHFSRCCALAYLLEQYHFRVRLFDSATLQENLQPSFLIVIDSYVLGLDSYVLATQYAPNCLFFDDTLRLPYPPSILLNNAFGADLKAYSLKYPHHKLWIGRGYPLLQEPFLKSLRQKKCIKEHISDVLVTLGGEDICNLMPKLLAMLLKNYPDLKLHYTYPKDLNLGEQTQRYEKLSPQEMQSLMQKVDIALCAGGQTLGELLACGVPCIALETAQNQRFNLEGYAKAILQIRDITSNLSSQIRNALESIKSQQKRQQMSDEAQNFFLGENLWENALKSFLGTNTLPKRD